MTATLTWIASWSSHHAADLARESDLLDRAARAPGLFTYGWERPAVVLGYGQPREDVDEAWCAERGVPLLRRRSGGTAVVHSRSLNIALALPAAHAWARSIGSLYAAFLDVVARRLRTLGHDVRPSAEEGCGGCGRTPLCFEGRGRDGLLLGPRRVAGGAQIRRRHAVLVHLALLLHVDVPLHAGALRLPAERIRRRIGALEDLDPKTFSRDLAEDVARALHCDLEAHHHPEAPRGLRRAAPAPPPRRLLSPSR